MKVALFRALADPTRLRALETLARGDARASHLAKGLGISPSRLSNHLSRLVAAGLVEWEREGRTRTYRLRHPELGRFLRRADALAALAEAARPRRRARG